MYNVLIPTPNCSTIYQSAICAIKKCRIQNQSVPPCESIKYNFDIQFVCSTGWPIWKCRLKPIYGQAKNKNKKQQHLINSSMFRIRIDRCFACIIKQYKFNNNINFCCYILHNNYTKYSSLQGVSPPPPSPFIIPSPIY